MDITVLNKSFVAIYTLDVFESLIWTVRYNLCGDFELYLPATLNALSFLQEDYYLTIPNSDRLMVIESIEIKTHAENGNKLLVKGRSLESILDRRIILQQTILDGSFQDGIGHILTQNAISSSQAHRNIPGLVWSPSSDANTLKAQYDGENVLDTLLYLVSLTNAGFSLTLNSVNQIICKVYYGKDRSYSQSINPFVIFSPSFDNLLNSEYFQSKRYKKTYALVFGDNTSGPAHRFAVSIDTTLTGLDLREMSVDASDLSKFYSGTSTELPVPDYLNQLKQRGLEALFDNSEIVEFQGNLSPSSLDFVYGRDYFLGDIVQFENEFGLTGRTRVTEYIISEDLSGIKEFPIFQKI